MALAMVSGVPSFPSPHSGILFLSAEEKERKRLINAAVSVPSFGDSFFMKGSEFVVTALDGAFPSPHSGILFLLEIKKAVYCLNRQKVSVPSFGDSFFIKLNLEESVEEKEVSVPSFGDSFFIG